MKKIIDNQSESHTSNPSPRITQNRDLSTYLDSLLVHKNSRERKSMKREKILERESRERK